VIAPNRFRHDCDRCIFLGEVGPHDLYICPPNETWRRASVVARYGDEGFDYTSMPVEYAEINPVLAFALRLARQRGLVQ
jgi:hypothetical protein